MRKAQSFHWSAYAAVSQLFDQERRVTVLASVLKVDTRLTLNKKGSNPTTNPDHQSGVRGLASSSILTPQVN